MTQTESLRLFSQLQPDIQARLLENLRTQTYDAGEHIFVQGDSVRAFYLVISGRVKIVRVTPEGYENILCVRGPGDHFCPVPLLDQGSQLGTAIAMTDVTLMWVERDVFAELCRDSAELQVVVQSDCLAEVRRLLNRLEVVAFRSVSQRLAHTLLILSRQQTSSTLQLTQQELAAMIGASRESVSRTLAEFERKGLVSIQRGRVILRNRAGLEKQAGEKELTSSV